MRNAPAGLVGAFCVGWILHRACPYFYQKSVAMKNAITTLRIQNFKSIKDVEMKPRRVNIFIGEPNVGKSNILEAMSLLGVGLYSRGEKLLGGVIRYESISNLFYDNDTSQPIVVDTSGGQVILQTQNLEGSTYHLICLSKQVLDAYREVIKKDRESSDMYYNADNDSNAELLKMRESIEFHMQMALSIVGKENPAQAYFSSYRVQENGNTSSLGTEMIPPQALPRNYKFQSGQAHNSNYGNNFLEPPTGLNLLGMIQRSPKLRKEIAALFKPYGLSLVLRVNERKFEIQKQVDDLVYNYPYSLIADTLQRIIFYLAAIESNDDAVILFEEPEAHSFPRYVSQLGQRIVESRNNQFFVATHSPYLITEILEEMLTDDELKPELAMFVAYYENYQTKVRQLSDEEVMNIRRDGLDVFYNMDRFIPQR